VTRVKKKKKKYRCFKSAGVRTPLFWTSKNSNAAFSSSSSTASPHATQPRQSQRTDPELGDEELIQSVEAELANIHEMAGGDEPRSRCA